TGPPPEAMTGGKEVELVDAARLGTRLRLRTWRNGDWFMPLGMKTRKKLSDFFTDEKVPRFEKGHIPILESDDAIVWVCGRRLDERFKVTPSTRFVVRLEYSPTIPT
ncbi:MAG: tRNA lysidine(34) synthetase TilS, partial [Bacteroidota bacterium]